MLNRDALIREADARVVARHIGMKVRKMGKNTFGECVSGLHSEKLHDNNVIYKDGCYCYSCGEQLSTIDMVMKFCQVDFKTACSIIAETIGGLDAYKGTGKRPQIMPLSPNECKLLGLSRRGKTSIDWKDVEDSCSEKTAESILRNPPMSLQILYNEDKDAFFSLCLEKAEEQMAENKALAEKVKDNRSLYSAFATRHNDILRIKQKLLQLKEKLAG